MRVRLLTSIASPAGAWAAGDLYDTDDATALRMIIAEQAVPFEVGGIELAVGESGIEQAVKPKGRKRTAARV